MFYVGKSIFYQKQKYHLNLLLHHKGKYKNTAPDIFPIKKEKAVIVVDVREHFFHPNVIVWGHFLHLPISQK